MDIRFDSTQNAALFRIRVSVGVKGLRNKVNLYLFIYPDTILSLESAAGSDDVPEPVRSVFAKKPFGTTGDIVALRFVLERPASLVGPENVELAPTTRAFGCALDSLRSLATATELTLFVASEDLSRAAVNALCAQAGRDGGLRLLAGKDSSLEMLYGGNSGKVIEVNVADGQPESPPSYDEIALTPPPPPQKRKRTEQRSPSSVEKQPSTSKRRGLQASPSSDDAAWKASVMEQMAELGKRVSALEEGFLAIADVTSPAAHSTAGEHCEHCTNLADRLTNVGQIVEATQVRLEEAEARFECNNGVVYHDELDERVEDVVSEINHIVEVSIDEGLLDAKDELREFISEQVKDVDETIRDDIRTAIQSI